MAVGGGGGAASEREVKPTSSIQRKPVDLQLISSVYSRLMEHTRITVQGSRRQASLIRKCIGIVAGRKKDILEFLCVKMKNILFLAIIFVNIFFF